MGRSRPYEDVYYSDGEPRSYDGRRVRKPLLQEHAESLFLQFDLWVIVNPTGPVLVDSLELYPCRYEIRNGAIIIYSGIVKSYTHSMQTNTACERPV